MGFDLSAVLERVGGDEEILQEIAQLFIDDSPGLVAQIRQAAEDQDAGALERSAHTLKGSASNFGAEETVQIALQLEMMGRDGNLSGVEAAYRALETEVNKLNEELAKIV